MASSGTMAVFTPLCNEPTTVNYATLDLRNSHPVLDFDASTGEFGTFTGVMPQHYSGGGTDVWLHWTAEATGDVYWEAAWERMDTGFDIDADGFAAVNNTVSTSAGTQGITAITQISFTNGADMDSVIAGDAFRLQLRRASSNGTDTLSADVNLLAVMVEET